MINILYFLLVISTRKTKGSGDSDKSFAKGAVGGFFRRLAVFSGVLGTMPPIFSFLFFFFLGYGLPVVG